MGMAESMDMDDDSDGPDLAEYVRLSLIFALLAIDVFIMWEAVKDRPDMLVLRQKLHDAIARPWHRYRELRKAEKHVVWEAMGVVEGDKEEQP